MQHSHEHHHTKVKSAHQQNSHHMHGGHHLDMIRDFKKRFFISLALTIPVLLLSPIIQQFLYLQSVLSFPGDLYILFILSTIIFFYGGWPFLKGCFDELANYQPGMMTLIAIAITVAYIYSALVVFGLSGMMFFWELATLIDIMLLGHWIEMKSIMGAGIALEKLVALMPASAHKIMSDGVIKDVALHDLSIGDHVLVKPGEKIPADGNIISGTTSVNESMLTGESKPVFKQKGNMVIGGSINGEGSITLQVAKMGEDTFLSQVIKLVKEAEESKSKTQDLANRAARWLTIIALLVGLLTLLIWVLLTQQSFAFALERTVTVMVITCPHALGLAVPLVVAVSTAIAASHGLLIRNRVAFENARHINALIFDKTGTLTKGQFGITDVLVFDSTLTKDELIKYAASLEVHSEHPIAKGIVHSSHSHFQVEDFKSIPGRGAEGMVNGKKVQVVSPGYIHEKFKDFNNKKNEIDIANLTSQGKTVVFITINGDIKGVIAVSDIIRPESQDAIRQLKKMGVRCIMLTGDNKQVAKSVAEMLGLDEYFAEVLPQDKVAKVKEVQSRGLVVGMAGDGVNDAPALATADVGIAIGAGTDVAIETADIILVKSNPGDVVTIIRLARATTKKMIQNLVWATGYNAIAIPLAAGVLYRYGILLSPAVGAVLMSFSTVIVAINARLLRIK